MIRLRGRRAWALKGASQGLVTQGNIARLLASVAQIIYTYLLAWARV